MTLGQSIEAEIQKLESKIHLLQADLTTLQGSGFLEHELEKIAGWWPMIAKHIPGYVPPLPITYTSTASTND